MRLFSIINIDQNIIQIYYNKNIKLFSNNFVNITLKIDLYIRKTNLQLEIIVYNIKSCFLLITFLNLYRMIRISQV